MVELLGTITNLELLGLITNLTFFGKIKVFCGLLFYLSLTQESNIGTHLVI